MKDVLNALITIGVVEFDVNGKKKKGVTSGTARGREVLSAMGIKKIDTPGTLTKKPVVVTT